MRVLRIAAPTQLQLDVGGPTRQQWWALPEPTQAELLVVLARLIAKGIVVEEGEDGDG